MTGTKGPLEGVRVLELGSFIAGPFAGQLLADLGAEVIKVESPGEGDPMRRWGTMSNGRSIWWSALARSKRLVAIDLRQPEGRSLVRSLASTCDVVLENFAPGRLEATVLRTSSRTSTTEPEAPSPASSTRRSIGRCPCLRWFRA